MATKPLAHLGTTWQEFSVKLIHNNNGGARMVVRINGRQRTVPFHFGARDPWTTAVLDACGVDWNDKRYGTLNDGRIRNNVDARRVHAWVK